MKYRERKQGSAPPKSKRRREKASTGQEERGRQSRRKERGIILFCKIVEGRKRKEGRKGDSVGLETFLFLVALSLAACYAMHCI